jgi:RimJ/RimL family protein N-acetyltransferase
MGARNRSAGVHARAKCRTGVPARQVTGKDETFQTPVAGEGARATMWDALLCLHTLIYRTAHVSDLDLLESELDAEAWQRLVRWLELSCTKPSWITLGLSRETLLDVLVLLTHPAYGIPLELVSLSCQRTGRPIDAGLLRAGIQCAEKHGSRELFYSAPRNSLEDELLGDFGFSLWRGVYRYRSAGHIVSSINDCSIVRAGMFTRGEIICLIERTSESCNDSQTKYFSRSLGSRGDAELTLQIMELTPHDPGWWLVALGPRERQTGLVLPVLNYGELTIGYIGVVPEFRGRGIASHLLIQLQPIVHRSGYSMIYAEVDKGNRSMHRTLAKSGFRLESENQEWRLAI